jgi:hypothetical protein
MKALMLALLVVASVTHAAPVTYMFHISSVPGTPPAPISTLTVDQATGAFSADLFGVLPYMGAEALGTGEQLLNGEIDVGHTGWPTNSSDFPNLRWSVAISSFGPADADWQVTEHAAVLQYPGLCDPTGDFGSCSSDPPITYEDEPVSVHVVSVVPEPMGLAAFGLLGLVAWRNRRSRI